MILILSDGLLSIIGTQMRLYDFSQREDTLYLIGVEV